MSGPPINDPKDGGYIVDGSFANPVPGKRLFFMQNRDIPFKTTCFANSEDIMRKFGAEYVLVINTTDGKTFEPQR